MMVSPLYVSMYVCIPHSWVSNGFCMFLLSLNPVSSKVLSNLWHPPILREHVSKIFNH